jgi:hypothetical protein
MKNLAKSKNAIWWTHKLTPLAHHGKPDQTNGWAYYKEERAQQQQMMDNSFGWSIASDHWTLWV